MRKSYPNRLSSAFPSSSEHHGARFSAWFSRISCSTKVFQNFFHEMGLLLLGMSYAEIRNVENCYSSEKGINSEYAILRV